MAPIRKIVPLLTGAALLGITGTALADTIVVRATGPSAAAYPPGKPITGDRVTLKAGDTLVLLDRRGTRTISGAGAHFLSTSGNTASPSALSALMRNTGTRQVRTGAVRGSSGVAARSPSLWFIDAAKGGTYCLPPGTPANLWRSDMSRAETLTVVRQGDGKSAGITFAAGQSVRAWPADLPVTGGAKFRVSGTASERSTGIAFATIPPNLDGPDVVAAQLIEKGCKPQLDLLVEAAATEANAG